MQYKYDPINLDRQSTDCSMHDIERYLLTKLVPDDFEFQSQLSRNSVYLRKSRPIVFCKGLPVDLLKRQKITWRWT